MKTHHSNLTPNHVRILELLSNGNQVKNIARETKKSIHSVNMQLVEIRELLEANNTNHAIAIALREKIIQ